MAACPIPWAVKRSDVSPRMVVFPDPIVPVITRTGTSALTLPRAREVFVRLSRSDTTAQRRPCASVFANGQIRKVGIRSERQQYAAGPAAAAACHSGCVVYRRFARQRELKRCAASGGGGDPEATSVRLHDRSADRQSHPGALRFRGEECVENPFHLLGRKSAARVTDRDQKPAPLVARRDGQLTWGTHILHGFDAIEHEIQQHL